MRAFEFTSVRMIVLASTLVPSPARAQDGSPQASKPSAVEITPCVALGSVRSSSIGAGISFPVTSNVSIQTEGGYRRGEGGINALSSSANLLYALPPLGRTRPYLTAGAGLEQYGAPRVLPDSSGIVTHSQITFAVNAGGGLKVPVDDNWGMRIDARWFKSFGRDGSSEHWRVAHGVSFGGKR